MKTILLTACAAVLLIFPTTSFAQAPDLGTAANFVLFSSVGAVTNTGVTHLTGNVGSNSGSSTGFGNVDGVMADGGPLSAQASTDLLSAYNELLAATPTFFPSALLGNGQILVPGVYAIGEAAILNLELILNGQGDPNAVFIFQIDGAFSTNALSSVTLTNGTLACNVFWKAEGMVSMASGTHMKGTVVADNAAIHISTGCNLEGRALSTTGEITVDGILAYTPLGCGTPILNGPVAPDLASTECYALFSGSGAVSNSGTTYVTGDVGTNSGLTTGFNQANVTGSVHPSPDPSTAAAASDLADVYDYLNNLPVDITLVYPAQFGNSLVLTPHTYLLDAATVFTDTLYLNAQGNANAVFVIKMNGALSSSTYSNVKLINGAQSKNVFWKVEGAVGINNYSIFRGTLVCHNGALGALNTGVVLDGRALTTTGALTTTALTVVATTIPSNCSTTVGVDENSTESALSIYPNPFSGSATISVNAALLSDDAQLSIYSVSGAEVYRAQLKNEANIFTINELPSGIYFYRLMDGQNIIQSGKLLAQD